jgi:hypothetical protein
MATHDEVLTPAERRDFWRWVGTSARPYVGWILLALGALAIFFGWLGVSGQSLTAKQLPYLVSGGLAGLALIVVGSVFLANDNLHKHMSRLDGLERKVDDLYGLLVLEPTPEPPAELDDHACADAAGVVALPAGSTFHRPTCALVAGKVDAAPVDREAIAARALQPCPVCEPLADTKRG